MKKIQKRILVWLLLLALSVLVPLPGMINEVLAESTPTTPLLSVSGDVGESIVSLFWSWPPAGWNTEWEVSLSPNMMDTAACGQVNYPENETSVDLADKNHPRDMANKTVYVGVRNTHSTEWGRETAWSNLYEVQLDKNKKIKSLKSYEVSPPSPEDCPDGPDGKHEWETKVTKEATCTEAGIRSTRCKHCGAEQGQEEISALGHDWERVGTRQEATCTEMGISDFRCRRPNCGATKSETDLPELDHSFTKRNIIRKPTCTEQGLARMDCVWCDEEGEQQKIPALGHDWERVRTVREATCQQMGTSLWRCRRPDCGLEKIEEDIPIEDHIWDESTTHITKQPTCTEKGEGYYTCSRCPARKPVDIPALGHQWERRVKKEPTCTEPGVSSMVCKRCGFEKPGSEEPIEPLDHEWERQVKKQPTCTEPGVSSMVCKRCGFEKPGSEEPIEALGHEWERQVKKEPTCTESGSASTVCSRCGLEQPGSEESIDPLGHQWERQVKKEPTCTEPGTASMVCSRCGQEKPGSEESIDPLGHEWERQVIKEPTCTEPGAVSMVCSRCGQEKPGSEELIEPLGHQWERKAKEKPTTSKPGVSIMACSRCKLEKPGSEEQIAVVTQEWIKGSGVPSSFTSDTAYTDFLHVKVDDIEVGQSHYDVTKDGTSTIITFKSAFLETLSAKEHHIVEIVSTTSSSFYVLKIKAKADQQTGQDTQTSDTPPKTGESLGHYSWLALMFLSAGGLIVLDRKKRMSKQRD